MPSLTLRVSHRWYGERSAKVASVNAGGLSAVAASQGVVGALVEVLVEELHRAVRHGEHAAAGVMALKSSATPRRTSRASRTEETALHFGGSDVEIDRQARPIHAPGGAAPDIVESHRNS